MTEVNETSLEPGLTCEMDEDNDLIFTMTDYAVTVNGKDLRVDGKFYDGGLMVTEVRPKLDMEDIPALGKTLVSMVFKVLADHGMGSSRH